MRTIEEIMGCLESCYGNESCSTGNHRCPYGDEGVIDCVDRLKVDYERIMATISKVSTLDRLEEICNAERDGRCEVLPCEVGDTVYCTNTGKIKEDVVISYRYDGTWSFMLENTGSVHWTIERFNRTVFLTREAAEQAKEREQ